MNINDFLIPVFVIIVIIGIFVFFKKKTKLNTDSKTIEPFQNNMERHDFTKYQINIGDNLFIGFNSKAESDRQINILQQAKMDFPDKMKNINPNKNSIVINNNKNNTVGSICLGSPKYSGDELTNKLQEFKICPEGELCQYYTENFLRDNYDRCLNFKTLQSFDLNENSIPKFLDYRGRQIYYNQDNPVASHKKLCFRDVERDEDVCLTKQDIEMINGEKTVKLKMKNDSGIYEKLMPFNLNYGYHKNFQGVVSSPHYMLEGQYSDINYKLNTVPNCYNTGRHYASGAGYYSDNYYLIPHPRPLSYYSHIHQHEDA